MSESILRIREQLKERQIQNIMALTPGRWLDALVGEYVMGLAVEEWLTSAEDPVDYWYRPHSALLRFDEREPERVPNYSTVIYAAMQIVPRFTFWAIEGNHNTEVVRASFSNEQQHVHWIEGCTTIPEAVCKAALIGLVHENKLLDKLLSEQ